MVKFDVVHFDTLGLAQYRQFVVGAATVLNHHNIESSMMEQRAAMETRPLVQRYLQWEAKKLRRAERHYCPQFSRNIVVSSEDAKTLSAIAPGCQTTVVANGVDTDFFTPRPDPGGESLLFCGGLDWYPNGEAMEFFFREIWPELTQRRPRIRVTVVGRNPPPWLTQLGQTDPRLNITGFVDDVRPYFRQATLYICPIRSGGGTRLKILDALAMGMPLISTTFACSGIAVEGERHVLLADTPRAFTDQVIRALDDRTLRERLAKEGHDHVSRHFAWSVVGANLHEAYLHAALSRLTKSSEGAT
jgi:glycosyltransferase involved in cell wall biosynthesis